MKPLLANQSQFAPSKKKKQNKKNKTIFMFYDFFAFASEKYGHTLLFFCVLDHISEGSGSHGATEPRRHWVRTKLRLYFVSDTFPEGEPAQILKPSSGQSTGGNSLRNHAYFIYRIFLK